MFLQLRMAAGYLAIFVMPALFAFGLWLERPYLAFGTVFLIFPLARSVFGGYRRRAPIIWREGMATCLDRLPLAYGFVLLCVVGFSVWMIEAGAAESPGNALGIGLSLWLTMLFATCPAHELIHRRDSRQACAGSLIAGLAGYPFLGYEHLAHHARFGDTARAEWPRLDESVWRFAARRIRRIADDTVAPGGVMWQRVQGLPGNTALRGATTLTLLTWTAFSWAGGLPGFMIYLGVIVGVTFGIQLITYLQHWGLGDDSLAEAKNRQFAWEDDCLFQAWMTLHLSFHQSHHQSPRLAYYRVGMAEDSPRPPAGYVLLMLICVIPALWQRLMLPARDRWLRQPGQALSSGRRLTCFAAYSGRVAGEEQSEIEAS